MDAKTLSKHKKASQFILTMRIVNLVVEHEQVQYRAVPISSNRYERKYTRRATIEVYI